MTDHYFLEAGIILTLLYGTYYLTVRKLTYFQLNRFILLSTILAATILPLLDLGLQHRWPLASSLIYPAYGFGPEIPAAELQAISPSHQVNWLFWLKLIYFTGLFISLIQYTYSLLRLYFVYHSSMKTKTGRYTHVAIHPNSGGFSFFNLLFIPSNNQDVQENEIIIAHEKIHARALHSIDNLLAGLFKAVFWFHPMSYLLHRSLRQQHEYAVDSELINKGVKTEGYLNMLLSSVSNRRPVTLINYFGNTQTKNRILMLTTSTENPQSAFRYLFLVPALAVTILLLSSASNPESGPPTGSPIHSKDVEKITLVHNQKFTNPISKKEQVHKGIDIVAKKGTPVYATGNGIVSVAEFEDSGWGNLVVVAHNDTYESWYAHLDEIAIKKGELVKQGQLIGYVGSTGRSTGPHLHYEIRENGERIDPDKFIVR